ncbi:MAG: zinc-dependent metalloprotease [Gemmatimonadota bacterium]
MSGPDCRCPLRLALGALALILATGPIAPSPAAEASTVQEAAPTSQEAEDEGLPTVEEKVEGMTPMEGFFDLHWDESEGTLYLEIDRWEEEFLYQISLASGLGSNPVGLDRGQLGSTHVVEARRVGPRVLLVEPNYGYRARSDDPAEVRAVRDAFAPSTLWGFEVVAETEDRVLVDATDFFLRDAHRVVQTLEGSDQGAFSLDPDRSTIHLPRTASFPQNTEVETWLTFTSDEPGFLVRGAAAFGEAVSLRQHHSLVQLPDDGYEPRRMDPRVGAFGIEFHDYATPIDQDLEIRWASRHRLEKRDPAAGSSEAVEPIVYYVDPGVPEPIRSALVEGASWWDEAFEAAGYEDAFRVEILPEDADPMDVRYNMIHWTHRRTRGWSYGSSVTDPRTGEILKGNVNLGSLRLRQDRLIGAGLIPPYGAGNDGAAGAGGAADLAGVAGAYCDLSAGPDFGYLGAVTQETSPTEMALARVRQLSAHEVGHTLGLAHNFAASTYGRASVMDYPAPLVRVADDGSLDLSDAYDVGIGEYDAFAVRWLYADFPEGTDEEAALDEIVAEGLDEGMRFLSDADARPAGAAHPLAGLWDNGSDPVAALEHELEVRRIGIEGFGPEAIREGEPVAFLEEVFVPLYLHHRYQLEATAHTLGGVDYSYAVRGDGQTAIRTVSGDRQRAALDAMLRTLEPSFLVVPRRIMRLLPPRAFGMSSGETFSSRTSPTFDPLGVAASAASFTLDYLLQPQRMARLVDQHARDESLPGLEEVVGRLMDATWYADTSGDARRAAVARTVERVVMNRLMDEAADASNTELVRAALDGALHRLEGRLAERADASDHARLALEDLRRWRDRPADDRSSSDRRDLPPGSPIGSGEGGGGGR